METRRVKTDINERHKVDLYYRRKYGVTLEEHEKRSENGCEVCGGRSIRRLHADHSHKLRYYKVTTTQCGKEWQAKIEQLGILAIGATKNEAIKIAREVAKRKSYRGALCFPCNGGLRKFRDNPQYLENAAKYLRKWEQSLKI